MGVDLPLKSAPGVGWYRESGWDGMDIVYKKKRMIQWMPHGMWNGSCTIWMQTKENSGQRLLEKASDLVT